jgi:hypothetical protein
MPRGRPRDSRIAIEDDPQRFELAAWHAFVGMGFGEFDAARRALLAVRGGEITIEDIETVWAMASARVPLPPHNPDEPDAGLRRLAAKARRQPPSHWLVNSSALIRAVFAFIETDNQTGLALGYDGLIKLGWGEVIVGLADRVEAALRSNLPPADVKRLSPAVRRLLAGARGQKSEPSN